VNIRNNATFCIVFLLLGVLIFSACDKNNDGTDVIPEEILEIMNQERYSDAVWSLRVKDVESGEVIYNLNPDNLLFTGSLRKIFSTGTLLNKVGADHRFITPVHRQGEIDETGVLEGDLILVADGDLTLGGRRTPEDTIAFTNLDHIDANAIGSAILTEPDVLAGLDDLAEQVADSGITKIEGEIIIDDRLFDKFNVPNGNRLITPIVVNDNLVDVTVLPEEAGEDAVIEVRPVSEAFHVVNQVETVPEGEDTDVELSQDVANTGVVDGQIAVNFDPDIFPGVDTLVQNFQIDDPSMFARTAFIEALERAGVVVTADLIGPNPSELLPPENSYSENTKLAELVSLPYSEYANLILKVSHNYGANLSLILLGVANGVRTVQESLDVERMTLVEDFGLNGNGFNFPTNGSGSPDSQASPRAVVDFLTNIREKEIFGPFFDSFPVLGGPGSLRFTDEGSPATGNLRGKTGTTLEFNPETMQFTLVANTLGGYIDAVSGKRLAFALFVNNVPIEDINDIIESNDDLGEIGTKIFELN